jgi:hypothetical protein
VFVDGTPIAPGKSLRSMVNKNDFQCKSNPDCPVSPSLVPDQTWLSARQVFLTRQQSVQLDSVTYLQGELNGRGNKYHQVTVVPLDSRGVRPSEAAWTIYFKIRR